MRATLGDRLASLVRASGFHIGTGFVGTPIILDALTAAYPDDPEMLETRSVRARHEEVTQQLAGIGHTACEPPPPPTPITLIFAWL